MNFIFALTLLSLVAMALFPSPLPPRISSADSPVSQSPEARASIEQQINPDAPSFTGTRLPIVQASRLIPSDGSADFGSSVSISGDTLVVGDPHHDIIVNYWPAVYIYYRNQGGVDHWGLVKKLTIPWQGRKFGYSVSISDDLLAVGDPAGGSQGVVYIFQRNKGGADNWGQIKELGVPSSNGVNCFCATVSLNGEMLFVSAPWENNNTGSVYLFARNQGGANNWGQVKRLTAFDGTAEDYFGWSISFSAGTLAVSAHNTYGTCSVYLYARNQGGADNWGLVTQLTPPDGSAQFFGEKLSISDDTLAIYDGGAIIYSRNQGGANSWGLVKIVNTYSSTPTVSIHGNTLLIGREVFDRNQGGADNWGEVMEIGRPDGIPQNIFPFSSALDGDHLLLGAPYNWWSFPNYGPGTAFVFKIISGNWKQVAQPTHSEVNAGDIFGRSVALKSGRLAVGAPFDTIAGLPIGSISIFAQNQAGADQWGLVRWVHQASGQENAEFARSIALSEEILAVGIPLQDISNYPATGAVMLFARNQNGPDGWGKIQSVVVPNYEANDNFGMSVAINGDILVVGAPGDDIRAGSIYLFTRNQGGASNWGLLKKLVAPDRAVDDFFGASVSINGDTLAVGARGKNYSSGSVYIFSRNWGGAENWGLVQTLANPNGTSGDYFGRAVAISGDTLVVGAHGSISLMGLAYTFARNQGGADNWGLVKTLVPQDARPGKWFGQAVAIHGDTVVVGAPRDNSLGSLAGAVYIYTRNQGGADQWGQSLKLTASDEVAGDFFGNAVAIDGDMLAVGADGHDDQGGNSGSVYVFYRSAFNIYLPDIRR